VTANDLREWVALFLPELTSDGQGGYRETVPVGLIDDIPAAVRDASTRTVFASEQTAQRLRYAITIRWMDGITGAYRIRWAGRYLNIETVKDVEQRNAWLELECTQTETGQQ
jgi:head-tail adaptor